MKFKEEVPLYLTAVSEGRFAEKGLFVDETVLRELVSLFGDVEAFEFRYSKYLSLQDHLWKLYEEEQGFRIGVWRSHVSLTIRIQ